MGLLVIQLWYSASEYFDGDIGAVLLSATNEEASLEVAGAQTLRVIGRGDALRRAAERVGGSLGIDLPEETARAAAEIEEGATLAVDTSDNMEFAPLANVLVDTFRDGLRCTAKFFRAVF